MADAPQEALGDSRSEADRLIAGGLSQPLSPEDLEMETAQRISEMKAAARQEYYVHRFINELKDRIRSLTLACKDQKLDLRQLRKIEIAHAQLVVERRKWSIIHVVGTVSMAVGAVLIGAYQNSDSRVLWMSAAILTGTGWAMLIIAAVIQIAMSVIDISTTASSVNASSDSVEIDRSAPSPTGAALKELMAPQPLQTWVAAFFTGF